MEENKHEFNKDGKIILYKDTPYYGFVEEANLLVAGATVLAIIYTGSPEIYQY